jgi:hypothetical protein
MTILILMTDFGQNNVTMQVTQHMVVMLWAE